MFQRWSTIPNENRDILSYIPALVFGKRNTLVKNAMFKKVKGFIIKAELTMEVVEETGGFSAALRFSL